MVTFACVPWSGLEREAVHDLLQLRQIVFVLEQACAFLDCDGLDREAVHVLGRDGADLVAYARILPPGRPHLEASIGRVVTHPWARRTGLGRALMAEAIAHTTSLHPGPIRIGAQRYLERFYGGLGFAVAGEPYLEDGIPHVPMLRGAPVP